MNNIKFRDAMEAIGFISVVLSVIFLAQEVNQANQLAQSTTAHEIHESFNDWHDLIIGNVEVAALLDRAYQENPSFTPAETRQVESIANRLFNIWLSIHEAYDNGLIDQADYETLSQDVPRAMEMKAMIPYWQMFLDTYPANQSKPILAPLMEARSQ